MSGVILGPLFEGEVSCSRIICQSFDVYLFCPLVWSSLSFWAKGNLDGVRFYPKEVVEGFLFK